MSEPQEIVAVDKSDLVGIVAELFAEGYRLVQIGCSTLPNAYELTYSFDREYRFKNLRFTVVDGGGSAEHQRDLSGRLPVRE